MTIKILRQSADALLTAVDLKTVFLASLIEKFIPVLPSYILFPAIGAGAVTGADLVWRCLIAVLGSIGGGMGWYAVGAAIGEKRVEYLIEQYGKWLFLKPKLYNQMSTSYRRNPFMITVLGQMVPTVRIFHALPAGVLRLPFGSFLLATALGALCWISALAAAGYILHLKGWSVSQTGFGIFAGLIATEIAALIAVVSVKKVRARLSGPKPATVLLIGGRQSVSASRFQTKGR